MDSHLFGTSVAISGTTVMAGAPQVDSAYVFSPFDEPLPTQRMGERGVTPYFGQALALEEDTAIVGAGFGNEMGAYVEELLSVDGSTCEADAACGSRHCASGVCCERACDGECASCEGGTCSVVRAGESGSPSCGGYVCDGEHVDCPTRCDSNGDCAGTHYCKGDECVRRLSNGSSCDRGRECQSNHCADGACRGSSENGASCADGTDCASGYCVDELCCDSACADQCEACDVAGSRGTCSPVVEGAPHGTRDACAGDDAICAGTCRRGNTRGCTFPTLTTSCAKSCADGIETPFTCDGRGACLPGEPNECHHLVCENDEVCKTSCERQDDCVPGYNCFDGACEARAICVGDSSRAPDGSTQPCTPFTCDAETGECRMSCTTPEECASGNACYPNGDCAPPEQAENANEPASEGCACSSVGKPRSPVTGALFGLVIALGIVARRRLR
jgi:MYXO-CTERM domain-containing protein